MTQATAIFAVNAVLSAITAGFGIGGAVRPALMTESAAPTFGERFFAWMYATRQVPLAALAAALPFIADGRGTAFVLFAAAASQIGDIVIGAVRGKRSMMLGGSLVAAVHALSGFFAL